VHELRLQIYAAFTHKKSVEQLLNVVLLTDVAGQERFGQMTRVYYKEAVGCFIVYDITRPSTFEAVIRWKEDLDKKVMLPDGSRIPCFLLANKVCAF
jgi:GTPase SAR1 family protein